MPPVFSGPLDEHPLFTGIKEAATKATQGATKVAKQAAHEAAPKAAPLPRAPVGAPLKGGLAKAAPAKATPAKAAPKSGALSSNLQHTFEPLGKSVGAPSKLASPKQQREAAKQEQHHSPISLHNLINLDTKAAAILTNATSQGTGPTSTLAALSGHTPAAQAVTGKEKSPTKNALVEEVSKFDPIKTVENIPSNAVGTATGVVTAPYEIGKASLEALKGNSKALGEIAKSFSHSAEHPFQTIEKEPVGAALMLRGGEAAVGKTVGKVAESGALGEKAAAVASTARPALKLYNDMEIPREYSSDVMQKGAQVAADKLREANVKGYVKDAKENGVDVARQHFAERLLHQDPNVATGNRLNRHIYGGGVVGQWLEQRGIPSVQGFVKHGEVDRVQAGRMGIRKMYSNRATNFMNGPHMKESLPKGHEEAVPLAVEGTLRRPDTVVEDLHRRLGELQDSAKELTGKELHNNHAQQDQVSKLLNTPSFLKHPEPVFEAARHFADFQHPLTEKKIQLGALEANQKYARQVPYALAHYPDAVYNADPGKHPLVSMISSADRSAKKAQREVKAAIAERDKASVQHPSTAGDHPVAQARKALKEAELGKSRIEGQLIGSGLKSLGREEQVKTARAAYTGAKADLIREKQTAVDAAKAKLLDARNAHHQLSNDLAQMKDSEMVRPDGRMYPRMERNGKPLTHDEIAIHARKELGDRELGFITHKEESYGQAMHAKSGVRPAIESRSRTGESYRNGTYDSSWQGLHKQLYKDTQQIAGHEGRDEMIRRFGIGSYKTEAEAKRAADNFNHTPDGERISKSLGKMEVAHAGPERILEKGTMPTHVIGDAAKQFGIDEHKLVDELGPGGKFRLMPASVVKRIDEHDKLNEPHGLTKLGQWFTNKWRSAALFSSPRWPVGTLAENAIRLGFAGVNPFAAFGWGKTAKLGGDLTDSFRALMDDKSLTEAQRFAARAHVANIDSGTQFGSYLYNSVRRESEHIPGDARTFSEVLAGTPVASQVVRGWQWWKDRVSGGLHKMEANTKEALLGKIAKDEMTKFGSDWKALHDRMTTAVDDYAHNALTPAQSAHIGEELLKMAGNWNTLTPMVRRAAQSYAPFGLWWLNSVKFVFQTLPMDHPLKSGMLAAMESATGANQQKEGVPEYLRGGIGIKLPVIGHVTYTPLHYSPFGIGVEPAHTAIDMLLPQLADAVLPAAGINALSDESEGEPFGAKPSEGTNVLKGIEGGAEGLIPGLRQGEAVARKGGKQVPGSLNPIATKPGSQTSLSAAIAKQILPIPVTVNRTANEETQSKGRSRFRPERKLPERKLPERALRER